MNNGRIVHRAAAPGLEESLAGLGGAAPADFALRVLRRAGIPRERYDTYLCAESPSGGLYVASGERGVTGAAPAGALAGPVEFEELHRARTGRSAIPSSVPPTGLLTALRTGRTKNLPVDPGPLPGEQRAALDAVRAVPRGQLRPIAWVAHEAGLTEVATVLAALAADPVPVLIPCHRITYDNAAPCDLGPFGGSGVLLRAAEGIDPDWLAGLSGSGLVLLGSDTTRIYCHPTCAHARRITTAHQVPFSSAGEAVDAGYRACKSCRPLAA
ncbi:Ada metal-binding domain-containing protein [Kitasatospora phosalacinea]|uniref:Ada metal-binding domain-containing protein n=1 Tax=Kitasatospora phosalacinea TaxID=2065 RepID=UPI00365BFBB6